MKDKFGTICKVVLSFLGRLILTALGFLYTTAIPAAILAIIPAAMALVGIDSKITLAVAKALLTIAPAFSVALLNEEKRNKPDGLYKAYSEDIACFLWIGAAIYIWSM